MTVEEKRKKVSDYCDSKNVSDCESGKCALNNSHISSDINCIGIGYASEEQLDRALALMRLDESTQSHIEAVNHPEHYQGARECIDVMVAMFGVEAVMDFCRCNAYKYRFRADSKGSHDEDIKKAEWYEGKLIELLSEVSE